MNKLYLIIVTNALNVQLDTLKEHLGYENMMPVEVVDLFEAQLIGSGVCLGSYGDRLLIVDPFQVCEFFSEGISTYECNICKLFPYSDIVALNLYSVVDMYGYSIIKEGKRVRTKWATDDEIYIDIGERIAEEDDLENDHDMCATVPIRLLGRYLGKESDLGNIMLNKYKE